MTEQDLAIQAALHYVQEMQHDFWDALSVLEDLTGLAFDDVNDYGTYSLATIKTLMEKSKG